MSRGRRIHDWGRSASIIAIIANANRNPKRRRRPYQPADFVPSDLRRVFRTPTGHRMTKAALHSLKSMFRSGRKKAKQERE
jgi:hypothetical protein